MYYLIGGSLLLVSFFLTNFLLSLIVSAIWQAFSRFTKNWTAAKKADFIFALRIFPAVASAFLVAALFLPAYLVFEPHTSGEMISLKLIVLVVISLIALFVSIYKVFKSLVATRRFLQDQFSQAEKITLENLTIPVFSISTEFPIVAVIGVLRPQILISQEVIETLSPGELRAAIAHEKGHLNSNDNLKRLLMSFCSHLTLFPIGKRLNREWAENAEIAADEYAFQMGGNHFKLELASTLVKLARLISKKQTAETAMPVGAFLIEESPADVTCRVRHILQLKETDFSSVNTFSLFRLMFFGVFGLMTLTFFNQPIWRFCFMSLESLFSILQ